MSDARAKRRRTRRRSRWGRRARNWLTGVLGPPLLRLWMGSLRYRCSGAGFVSTHPAGRPNVIYVFWHQRLLAFTHSHRHCGVRVLVSEHQDGEMISRVLDRLGFRSIRGSSTRGGAQAMKSIIDDLGSGFDYGFTPDGPRGPRHVFQRGAVFFASLSGLPVVAASVSYDRCWTLPTWDGFLIPRPFTRATLRLGEAIRVPPNLSDGEIEVWRSRLEEQLRAITAETEERFEEFYREGVPLRVVRRGRVDKS